MGSVSYTMSPVKYTFPCPTPELPSETIVTSPFNTPDRNTFALSTKITCVGAIVDSGSVTGAEYLELSSPALVPAVLYVIVPLLLKRNQTFFAGPLPPKKQVPPWACPAKAAARWSGNTIP